VITLRCIKGIVLPPNRWMELQAKVAPPLQEDEQGRRHFGLQLIQDVRRH
jgi:hypothetical protein